MHEIIQRFDRCSTLIFLVGAEKHHMPLHPEDRTYENAFYELNHKETG